MEGEPEKFSVVVRVRSLEVVQDWIKTNVPLELHPELTLRPTNNGDCVIRATFTSQHYAALFKLFWLHSK